MFYVCEKIEKTFWFCVVFIQHFKDDAFTAVKRDAKFQNYRRHVKGLPFVNQKVYIMGGGGDLFSQKWYIKSKGKGLALPYENFQVPHLPGRIELVFNRLLCISNNIFHKISYKILHKVPEVNPARVLGVKCLVQRLY